MSTFEGIQLWIDAFSLGDLASILGLFIAVFSICISVFGFVFTVIRVNQSKKAVEAFRSDLAKHDFVSDLSSAIEKVEEIKRLQRNKDFQVLLEKYSGLVKILIKLSMEVQEIDHEKRSVLQSSITLFRRIEILIVKNNASKKNSITDEQLPKLDWLINRESDKLSVLLLEIKNQIGR